MPLARGTRSYHEETSARRQQQVIQARASDTLTFWEQRLHEFDEKAEGFKLARPPARERIAERAGGGYRSRQLEDWDWYYELDPKERDRISKRWMVDPHEQGGLYAGARKGNSPSVIENSGQNMGEWLAITRHIDAAKAVIAGKGRSSRTYGGKAAERWMISERDARAMGMTEVSKIDPSTSRGRTRSSDDLERSYGHGVKFFTDKNGVVHPIRSSEPQSWHPYKSSGPGPAWDEPAF